MVKQFIDEESGKIIEKSVMNAITIDCVIFTFDEGNLEVLLIQHAEGISKGKWGLPGGWIKEDESIDTAAHRLLRETTGIHDLFLEQLKAFGAPERFPLARVITIGYYALIKKSDFDIKAGFTAADAKWFNMKDVDKLIYDHNEILNFSLENLRAKVKRAPIGFNLLPEKFTLLQLMQLYQEVLGVQLDKPNFRRKILKMKLLIALDEKETNVSHRAAKLFKFDQERYDKLTEKGFIFEV